MVQVDEAANGHDVELREGETLEISLPENPTTGFQWSLKASGEPVCLLASSSFDASAGPPGRGGTRHWLFQGVQPGRGRIELAYRRAWKEGEAPSRTFTLGVRVAPS